MARLITLEQGKTLPDAEGDVMRGLQVVEQCCSLTNLLLGETLPGVTKDMDLTSMRTPLGVCAGIAPFNFPAMIPLWDEEVAQSSFTDKNLKLITKTAPLINSHQQDCCRPVSCLPTC